MVNTDIMAPVEIILPTNTGYTVAPKTGTICVSGSDLVWYDGSAFVTITTS